MSKPKGLPSAFGERVVVVGAMLPPGRELAHRAVIISAKSADVSRETDRYGVYVIGADAVDGQWFGVDGVSDLSWTQARIEFNRRAGMELIWR